MANYIDNAVFINGSKQDVVNFLNKGLKGNKAQERVSISMSGEEIVALINGMELTLSMGSFIPRPKTFDTYDTTNKIKSFEHWFGDGCVPFFVGDADMHNQRWQVIIDYLKAHPEEFQPNENGIFDMRAQGAAIERLYPGTNAAYTKYMKGYYQAKYYQKKKYGVVGWLDWNEANYGCKWDAEIGGWQCLKDTQDSLCLCVYMDTPWSPAYKFVEKINAFDGITVYAYACGDPNYPFFFWYNGRINKSDIVDSNDAQWEQRQKEIDDIKEQKMAAAGNLRVDVIDGFEYNKYAEQRMPIPEPSEYEWIRVEDDEALVGVSGHTPHSYSEIGEVVSVDFVPAVGKVVPQGEVIGSVKTVKTIYGSTPKTVETVYNLYMPAAGEVLAFNTELQDHLELANDDPYETGWMIRIRLSDPSEVDKLRAAQRARWKAEEEWRDATFKLDDNYSHELAKNFKKEIYAEMGIEYIPRPESKPEQKPESEQLPFTSAEPEEDDEYEL